jgi:hypothetical protein
MSESDILLIHNSLNEVLNGIPPTQRVLMLDRRILQKIAEEWSISPSAAVLAANKDLIVATVKTVLVELGNEFETRVGVSHEAAERFVTSGR